MLSFPPDLRSVQRGCQVHSVTRASAERTGRSSIDSERVTAAVCGTSRAQKQQKSKKNKSSVHGSARKSAADKSFFSDGGAPLDCGVWPGYRGGDDNNMDAARLSAVCPPLPQNGLCQSEALGWEWNPSPRVSVSKSCSPADRPHSSSSLPPSHRSLA